MKAQLGTKEFNDSAMEMFGGKPKQQTAMQEMIKKLEEKRDMWKADGKLSDRQIRGTYVIAIIIAKELLEMEKQQMIDFANDLLARNNKNYIALPDLAEQYYNETFKNK